MHTSSSDVDAASREPHLDLAGALHDVSNALTVLLGWVGEARAPGSPSEDVTYALAVVEQHARIARDLARRAIGAVGADARRELSDLGGVVDDVVRALKIEAQHASVRLAVRRSSSANVAGALDLSQVLTNLVLNAIAFSPPGMTVDVVVEVGMKTCAITVSDQGPGVGADRREAIFAGDSQRRGGAGVGLRHSRAIARAWAGDVVLSHRTPGAHFVMTWPRADAIPRPPLSAASAARMNAVRVDNLGGISVLLLEDDAAVVQLLETALDARGADVTTASSASELRSVLSKAAANFEVFLVDLSPIAADVVGAFEAIRAGCPNAAIVLMTGNADALPENLASEVAGLVRKPFELGEVIAAVRLAHAKRA